MLSDHRWKLASSKSRLGEMSMEIGALNLVAHFPKMYNYQQIKVVTVYEPPFLYFHPIPPSVSNHICAVGKLCWKHIKTLLTS